MFKSKTILAAIAVAAIAFGAVALKVNADAQEIAALNSQVEQLKSEKAVKQSEVDTLASAVDNTTFVNRQLLAERQIIAEIRTIGDAEKARLRTELAALNTEVDALRKSNDEHVKSWANTPVPVGAVQLLKYAGAGSGNADSGSGESDLSHTSGRIAAVMYTNHSF